MHKDLYKIDDVKVNDVIILIPLSFVQINKKQKNMQNTTNSVISDHIMVRFCTRVAHDETISHSKKKLKSALTS